MLSGKILSTVKVHTVVTINDVNSKRGKLRLIYFCISLRDVITIFSPRIVNNTLCRYGKCKNTLIFKLVILSSPMKGI